MYHLLQQVRRGVAKCCVCGDDCTGAGQVVHSCCIELCGRNFGGSCQVVRGLQSIRERD